MSRALRLAPLIAIMLLVAVLVWRLANPPDATVKSALVGQPIPVFALPAALPGKPPLRSAELANGTPQLVNIFASWCAPCVAEAPVLAELRRRGVAMSGIAIRDRPQDLKAFLDRNGDPFERIGSDSDSGVQLALGSSGVPESLIVDGQGVIRYHHVGQIFPKDIPLVLAELEKAR